MFGMKYITSDTKTTLHYFGVSIALLSCSYTELTWNRHELLRDLDLLSDVAERLMLPSTVLRQRDVHLRTDDVCVQERPNFLLDSPQNLIFCLLPPLLRSHATLRLLIFEPSTPNEHQVRDQRKQCSILTAKPHEYCNVWACQSS